MAEPLNLLAQRLSESWFLGVSSQEFFQQTNQALQSLKKQPSQSDQPMVVFLSEPDPVRFLAHFIAACSVPCYLFLCNPNWTDGEWQQVFRLVQPDVVFGGALGTHLKPAESAPQPELPPLPDNSTLIMIPTGGSSGQIRFAIHTWETLMASVAGFQQHFEQEQVNSLCVLPLYHVSGLMQFMRSFTSGGTLAIVPFKAIVAGELPPLDPKEFFLSLVPTQLQRLLTGSNALSDWVTQFKTVLLGGAPAWQELLASARCLKVRLAPTYGMTETASQIATLKPDEFLNGQTGCGRLLPHANIQIQNEAGDAISLNEVGKIIIQAKSLMQGYFPFLQTAQFIPDDLGFFDRKGFLHIVGRQSDKIITGGENVYPAEIEAAIWETGLVQDVCVVGIPDREWGQVVTAVYIPTFSVSVEDLKSAIAHCLCKFKQPKRWIAVKHLPRNAQGKINRQQVIAQVQPTAPTIE